uniref:Uncharacterized protein n=1 Tax=Tanacetum cinerariifolium TaxID=118510 RepID=A0A699KUT5_TANCI|nr:hypothetical protein [Tanacetum cinerariifolium]
MSTLTCVDSETITQANGAQISRLLVLLPDDPYVSVRQAQLVDTEISSDSTASLSPGHPLTHVLPTPTPTRVLVHCKTARMAMHTQPTLSSGMSARIAKAAALSLSSFRKRYRSSYETPSPSSSLTLPMRKRYRGTSKLILDIDTKGDELGERILRRMRDDEGQGFKDEGPGMEEEEKVAPEGQQQAVPVANTAASELLGLGYGGKGLGVVPLNPEDGRIYSDIPTYIPLAAPVQTPLSPECRLRENHDLIRQVTEERREQLELTDRVARMERRQESGEE